MNFSFPKKNDESTRSGTASAFMPAISSNSAYRIFQYVRTVPHDMCNFSGKLQLRAALADKPRSGAVLLSDFINMML